MATINTIYQDDGTTINTIYDVQTISTEGAKEVLTVSGAGSLALPAFTVVTRIILEGSSGAFSIGTTLAGDEIYSGTLTSGMPFIWNEDLYYNSVTTLHFTGTFTARVYTE